jgi:Ca2+-binding RTX toxin-like protein
VERGWAKITYGNEELEIRYQGMSGQAAPVDASDFIFADGDPGDPGDPPVTKVEVFGTESKERIDGTSEDETIYGLGGDDDLRGGKGNDILVDGTGVDSLRGGNGADVYVFVSDGERDQATHFEDEIDVIDISAWGVTDFSQLDITQVYRHGVERGWAKVNYADEELEIRYLNMEGQAAPIDASDFIFA